MAKKPRPRPRYSKGCNGKISYATQSDAGKAKQAMHGKGHYDARLNVYACPECRGFHIGRERRDGRATATPDHRRDSFKNRKARYLELIR